MGVKLEGLGKAKAAFRAVPAALRLEYGETTQRTVTRIEALAKGFVSRRLGHLQNAIGSSFSAARGSGIVGVRKMTIPVPTQRFLKSGQGSDLQYKQPEFYGMLVHNGGLHNPNPNPFMLKAAEAGKDGYIADVSAATVRVCDTAGGRFL